MQELIKTKEQELTVHSQKKKILSEIKILQEQLQSILKEEVQKKIRLLSQRYFEGADKPGKFLDRWIKKQRAKAIITKIKIDGVEIVDHQKIKESFVCFFENLYRKKMSKEKEIRKYLEKFQLTKISESLKEQLNKEVEQEEILTAIDAMHKNKSPGPDGYTANFYKKN